MNQPLTAIDLFAGCGGLSCGFEQAGWSVFKAYESNPNAALVYNINLNGHCVREILTPSSLFPACDLVLAGPPCQPFSVAGKQLAEFDQRDGVPIFLQAMRTSKPKIGVMENVANLKKGHPEYVEKIVQELQSMGYNVSQQILNAADYGVPQNRKRFFLVAHHGQFDFNSIKKITPSPTVLQTLGTEAFLASTGQAQPHLLLTPSMDTYIERYEQKSKCRRPRDLHPHQPARTLTCRNLCGRTSDMIRIRLDNGQRRELTVEEAARLSGYPSTFHFPEEMSRAIAMKCIGNAVPPPLARCLAETLKPLILQ